MNRISEYRARAGLSQTSLAESLGWGQGRLGNYEREHREPGLSECRAIVGALNAAGVSCSLDDVFPPEEASQAAA